MLIRELDAICPLADLLSAPDMQVRSLRELPLAGKNGSDACALAWQASCRSPDGHPLCMHHEHADGCVLIKSCIELSRMPVPTSFCFAWFWVLALLQLVP